MPFFEYLLAFSFGHQLSGIKCKLAVMLNANII